MSFLRSPPPGLYSLRGLSISNREEVAHWVRGFRGSNLGIESHARALREEFRSHFLNISRIMDCVGCDKCRLWGKVQIHGMGTALKILFSDLPHSHFLSNGSGSAIGAPFQLTRNEVVSLFQSLGRYSSSIKEIGEFRKEMIGSLRGVDEL